jgi:hypothetical protein
MNVDDVLKRIEQAKSMVPREANKLLGVIAVECQIEIYKQNQKMLAELEKIAIGLKLK